MRIAIDAGLHRLVDNRILRTLLVLATEMGASNLVISKAGRPGERGEAKKRGTCRKHPSFSKVVASIARAVCIAGGGGSLGSPIGSIDLVAYGFDA